MDSMRSRDGFMGSDPTQLIPTSNPFILYQKLTKNGHTVLILCRVRGFWVSTTDTAHDVSDCRSLVRYKEPQWKVASLTWGMSTLQWESQSRQGMSCRVFPCNDCHTALAISFRKYKKKTVETRLFLTVGEQYSKKKKKHYI